MERRRLLAMFPGAAAAALVAEVRPRSSPIAPVAPMLPVAPVGIDMAGYLRLGNQREAFLAWLKQAGLIGQNVVEIRLTDDTGRQASISCLPKQMHEEHTQKRYGIEHRIVTLRPPLPDEWRHPLQPEPPTLLEEPRTNAA